MSRCYKVFLREKGSGILGTLWKGKLGEREFMTDIAQRNIVRVTKVRIEDDSSFAKFYGFFVLAFET